MPSFFTSGKTAALIGAESWMQLHHRAGLQFAVFVRCLVLGERLAQEGKHATVGPGGRLDHVRHEFFVGDFVAVGQIFAAAAIFRFAVGHPFPLPSGWLIGSSLPSMWLRKSKSPRWAIPSSSPNSPAGKNGNAYSMSAVPTL